MSPLRRRVVWQIVRLAAAGAAAGLVARAQAAPSPAEQQRIESLIRFVEGQPGIRFVRNDTAYTPAQAGKFLRGKLESMGSKVETARQFIDQIATRSSTSGKPYTVQLPDGRSVPAAQFLGDELARIERGS